MVALRQSTCPNVRRGTRIIRQQAGLDPVGWPAWEARTSYWLFAAMVQGRARLGKFGAHAPGGGVVVWLGATLAHIPLAGWTAGIWRRLL